METSQLKWVFDREQKARDPYNQYVGQTFSENLLCFKGFGVIDHWTLGHFWHFAQKTGHFSHKTWNWINKFCHIYCSKRIWATGTYTLFESSCFQMLSPYNLQLSQGLKIFHYHKQNKCTDFFTDLQFSNLF